jgi:hypothetical protein
VPAYQQNQQVERARADGYEDQTATFIRPEQTSGPAVEAKTFEQENLGGGERVHGPISPRLPARPAITRGSRLIAAPEILRLLRKIQNN